MFKDGVFVVGVVVTCALVIDATRRLGGLAAAALVVLVSTGAGFGQCEGWLPGAPVAGAPTQSFVRAVTWYDPDGSGPRSRLAVFGGDFISVGDVTVGNLAAWDGDEVVRIAGVGASGVVRAMLEHDGDLIVAGRFSALAGRPELDRIARWDGTDWHALPGSFGSEPEIEIRALVVFNNEIIAAGAFGIIDNVQMNSVARFDGKAWHPFGAGLMRGSDPAIVLSLAVHQGELIAGGDFDHAGGDARSLAHIARWDGQAWAPLDKGVNDNVRALAVFDDQLVAGGDFSSASGAPASRLAAWDGASWTEFAGGVRGGATPLVLSLVAGADRLLVGGNFDHAGETVATNIAAWDGASWRPIGTGVGGLSTFTHAIAESGDDILAGGSFTRAGSRLAARIASWDGESWRGYGDGLDSRVVTFATDSGALYAGGHFGGFVAKRTGEGWEVVGAGMNSSVYDLCMYNGRLVAGGVFTTADLRPANRIATWDGDSWEPLGEGLNSDVRVLAVYNGELIAGGRFTTADGAPASRIARWNGAQWLPLGAGSSANVEAMIVHHGELYASGSFTIAGGGVARVARWNGSIWRAVGSGALTGNVSAFAEYNNALVVGGSFTRIGGVPVTNIATWNGVSWNATPSARPYGCSGLAVHQGTLYCVAATGAAVPPLDAAVSRWVGSAWQPLGAGLARHDNGELIADAVASFGDDVVVGGYFFTAGGMRSDYFARWTTTGLPGIAAHPGDLAIEEGDAAMLAVELSPSNKSFGAPTYQWYHDDVAVTDGAGGASPGGGDVIGATEAVIHIESCRVSDAGAYRCVVANDCGATPARTASLAVIPVCGADFNDSGTVDSQDFFDYLGAFFASDPSADFNQDAVLNSQDFFDFLTVFLDGC